MDQLERFRETVQAYQKYGWRLQRMLMNKETLSSLAGSNLAGSNNDGKAWFDSGLVQEAPLDAIWFVRASEAGREAWELRLVADPPYALFETFEVDEAEEDREDVRREMEARLREYATRT